MLLQFFFVGTFFQKDVKDVLLNVNLELGLLIPVEPLPDRVYLLTYMTLP